MDHFWTLRNPSRPQMIHQINIAQTSRCVQPHCCTENCCKCFWPTHLGSENFSPFLLRSTETSESISQLLFPSCLPVLRRLIPIQLMASWMTKIISFLLFFSSFDPIQLMERSLSIIAISRYRYPFLFMRSCDNLVVVIEVKLLVFESVQA